MRSEPATHHATTKLQFVESIAVGPLSTHTHAISVDGGAFNDTAVHQSRCLFRAYNDKKIQPWNCSSHRFVSRGIPMSRTSICSRYPSHSGRCLTHPGATTVAGKERKKQVYLSARQCKPRRSPQYAASLARLPAVSAHKMPPPPPPPAKDGFDRSW